MFHGRANGRKVRGQRGAASQRWLLALGASALLTIAVSVPMAYQAREARQHDDGPPVHRVEVLGTSTVKDPEPRTDALYFDDSSGEPLLLDGSSLAETSRLLLLDDEAVRADFRLDDGPVVTVRSAPYELDGADLGSGESSGLASGEHTLTVTVTYADGHVALHQVTFDVTD